MFADIGTAQLVFRRSGLPEVAGITMRGQASGALSLGDKRRAVAGPCFNADSIPLGYDTFFTQ